MKNENFDLKNDVRFIFIPYSLFCFIHVMDFLPIIVSNMISISSRVATPLVKLFFHWRNGGLILERNYCIGLYLCVLKFVYISFKKRLKILKR
jgi:hypothetical protein